ncbi:hypothetical protein N7461_003386 [Penicillium sp. DV-2018c]|nr:hypothetical protein N7461_003386 [Penicillium sp. DV-2018c]
MQSQFTICMDEAHDYKIGTQDFDPDTIFPEIIALGNQLSALLQKQLTPLQESEFENHVLHCLATIQSSAGRKYQRTLEKWEEIILQTHKILAHKVDAESTPWEEYSGVYRTDKVSTGLHPFPHHSLVPYKMKAMVREFQSGMREVIAKGTIDPIAIASKYTHIFVNIHPFIDGNGRMCRLILNSILLKLGSFLVCIGEKEEYRSLYMEVASNGGALEDMYGDLDDEERPVMHRELGSFVMSHVSKRMRKLVSMLS